MGLKRTLLIDADIVAYKFAAKAQRVTPFGIAVDDLESVTPLVDECLTDWMKQLKATDLIICLSGPSAEGWRLDYLPTYKGNRKDVVRPELLMPIKDYLADNYPSYRRPSLEADDIMGILSTHPTLIPGQKVIVSEDKDMKTIPGWLFNPAKDSKARLISPEEADYWHLYQTLLGDTTDGYKGCPGAGPKAWEKFFGSWEEGRKYIHVHEAWPRMVELYESKGFTEADALVQARVARICRHDNYNFKTKEVIPWTPPPQPTTSPTSPKPPKPPASPAPTKRSTAKPLPAATRPVGKASTS